MYYHSMGLIFLTGMSRAGKTVTGEALARFLNIGFFDTDLELKNKHKCSIMEIYSHLGESSFRHEEFLVFKNLVLNTDDGVISTGGGFACNSNALMLLQNYKSIVFIDTSASVIFERIKAQILMTYSYPAFLGTGINTMEDAKNRFFKLYKKRVKIYRKISALRIKADNISAEEAAIEVAVKLKQTGYIDF